ncbi:MAG: glycerol-3-phosphate acyltransferase [Chloroflexi bacterium]|nr:glycerol-3-phosphate acyltransferase [Chloroflexota bacterium]
MPQWLQIPLVLLYAYLIGSVSISYILGRLVKRIDLRQYGSGNLGGSNVWVHVGKPYIIPVGLFDLFIKAGSPVWIAGYVLGLSLWVQVAAGLMAVVGHNWSAFLRLRGGRGVAPAIGILAVLAQVELALFATVAVVGWRLSRSSALWVGISLLLLPVWTGLLMWSGLQSRPFPLLVLMLGLVAVTALKRLLSNPGTSAPTVPLRQLLLNRLLYDRDVPQREKWLYRKPDDSGAP